MSLTLEMLGPSPELARLGAGEHNDGGGLYLIVRDSGAASWKFKFTLFGKATKMGLGSLSERSVEEARELAHRFRRLVRDGKDPRNERTAMGAAGNGTSTPVFKAFAHEMLGNLTFKNPKSLQCWKRAIDIHFAALHTKQMHEVSIDDVVAVLKPLYATIPSIGRECRQRLEYFFEAAIARHPEAMGRNVATRSLLKTLLPKLPKKGTVRGSHPSLNYMLMPQFWVELRAIETISAKALQLLILSGVRTGELLQMAFKQVVAAEYEIGAKRWVIPGKVMKHKLGIPADVPLSPTALAIVAEMRALLDARGSEKETLVFPGVAEPGEYGDQQDDNTMLSLIQRTMGYDGTDKPRVTTHGFRSTFRSWGQDLTDHSVETLEFCLHHIVGDEAAKAYKNGAMWKKRKACLLDWEAYVTSLERQAAADKVVTLAA
jgi:integrase